MICSVFFNLILLCFPVLCYFLYLIYSKANLKNENNVFLDLTVFMSFYLFVKYGELDKISLYFTYIPFMLLLFKKRYAMSLLILFLVSFQFSSTLNLNIISYLITNIIILLICIYTKIKKENIYLISAFLHEVFISILYNKVNTEILLSLFLTYVLIKLAYYLYKKFEDMLNVYYSLNDVIREKKFYESLFKITHEIKNPLAVCKGYLDMFDINNKKKTNKYVGIINQEINRTLELLKDFSDVSKSIEINKINMDITLLLEDVCDEAKFVFNKDIRFNYVISKEEYYIEGDYNRLKQVLINIIKNARESIDKRGIVMLDTRIKKNYYEIVVTDDGCGMEKIICDKIGTPFFTTKKNGTGLGVCFSKEIIEKHGGIIKYYSKLGEGTKVVINLPLKKA